MENVVWGLSVLGSGEDAHLTSATRSIILSNSALSQKGFIESHRLPQSASNRWRGSLRHQCARSATTTEPISRYDMSKPGSSAGLLGTLHSSLVLLRENLRLENSRTFRRPFLRLYLCLPECWRMLAEWTARAQTILRTEQRHAEERTDVSWVVIASSSPAMGRLTQTTPF